MPLFFTVAVYVHALLDDEQVEQVGWFPLHFSLAVRHWSQALETLVRFTGLSFAWTARRLEELCADMNCN